ncbi:MAG: hypothetical protein ACE5PT_14700, partial [Gemmatimonadales bacterium]
PPTATDPQHASWDTQEEPTVSPRERSVVLAGLIRTELTVGTGSMLSPQPVIVRRIARERHARRRNTSASFGE